MDGGQGPFSTSSTVVVAERIDRVAIRILGIGPGAGVLETTMFVFHRSSWIGRLHLGVGD
jgi:hypothetical protein